MFQIKQLTDLGFADAHLPRGTHICQIYTKESERNEIILKFLLTGVLNGECCACYNDQILPEILDDYFRQNEVSLNEALQSGALTISPSKDAYLTEGRFIPDRLYESLKDFYHTAMAAGFTAARIIGELPRKIQNFTEKTKIFEYESTVNKIFSKHPITSICQYHAKSYNGDTILEIMKVHPMIYMDETIISNPFYIPHDEYVKRLRNPEAQVEPGHLKKLHP